MCTRDVIVIGAGPAGLAFCASEANLGRNILLVEAGKAFEKRDSLLPEDVGSGVTGAGAYIDGKLSFFPAGTALWRGSYDLLSRGFAELREKLLPYSDSIPEMPSESEILAYLFNPEEVWKLKAYKSIYLDNEKRFEFLRELVQAASANATICPGTRVVKIKPSLNQDYRFRVTLRNEENGVKQRLRCRQLVLAGGRFMPLQQLLRSFQTPQKDCFRRHEFGVRLQLPCENRGVLAMAGYGCLDPKFVIQPTADVQFRTFCFCRRGMVCQSNIDGVKTYSGRADVEPTLFTNFGLMARTKNSEAFEAADIEQFLREPFEITISQDFDLSTVQFRLALIQHCGEKIGRFIADALEKLFDKFPKLLCPELRIFGPCLEGVGTYPNTNHLLEVEGIEGLYAIGDTSGTFRGLVPSLLSGFYLAQSMKSYQTAPLLLTTNKEKIMEIRAALGPLPSQVLDDRSLYETEARPHAIAKAKFAAWQLGESRAGRDLLVEVSSLEIDVLNGYPGVHVRSFFEHLGVNRIIAMASGSGATFVVVLALVDEDGIHCFEGRCRGRLVPPSGDKGFDWDCIFQPDGYDMTYGQMDRIIKAKISARFLAAVQLRNFLASQFH